MATYGKQLLSGSTNGRSIEIAATSTTIHTAVSGTSDLDEIYLWAANNSADTNVELTVEFGGTTSTDDHITYTIPFGDGLHLIVPGLLLQNSLVLGAFASVTSTITVNGYVNRINA